MPAERDDLRAAFLVTKVLNALYKPKPPLKVDDFLPFLESRGDDNGKALSAALRAAFAALPKKEARKT